MSVVGSGRSFAWTTLDPSTATGNATRSNSWVPLLLGFFGAGLLFSASIYLIIESRLAMATTYEEMDYIDRNYMRRE